MAATTNQLTVIEEYTAAPPPTTVSDMSIPLTGFDMAWIGVSPIPQLLFYKLTISKSDFIDNIIPQLKNSLNLTLQHFPSLAGNLIIPSDLSHPEIHYVNGDSVLLIFAKSDFGDFDYLTSNQPRNCGAFYPFVPQVPKSSKSPSGLIKVPLLAIQVTLFPGIGICIGISWYHVVADGSSIYAFIKAWAKLSQLGGNETSLGVSDEHLPYYNRDVMSHTKELDHIMWSHKKNEDMDMVRDPSSGLNADTDKVRVTFVIGIEDVKKLKNLVLSQQSGVKQISTFTVVCTFVWICLIKSDNVVNDKVDEDSLEGFGFFADPRGRDDPHIPKNYFGNCLVLCATIGKNKELVAEDGFLIAAERTGQVINNVLRNKDRGPFDGGDEMIEEYFKIDHDRVLNVAGSPKQNFYDMDFGWGKPKKMEFLSIDANRALSISGCKDSSGGVEIALALPKKKMDVFIAFFNEGLKAF